MADKKFIVVGVPSRWDYFSVEEETWRDIIMRYDYTQTQTGPIHAYLMALASSESEGDCNWLTAYSVDRWEEG